MIITTTTGNMPRVYDFVQGSRMETTATHATSQTRLGGGHNCGRVADNHEIWTAPPYRRQSCQDKA